MLSVLADLSFAGINVNSVADGLDSTDDESQLGIQIRGLFNELQLQDLKKDSARIDRSEETKVLDGRKSIRIQVVSVWRNGQG